MRRGPYKDKFVSHYDREANVNPSTSTLRNWRQYTNQGMYQSSKIIDLQAVVISYMVKSHTILSPLKT